MPKGNRKKKNYWKKAADPEVQAAASKRHTGGKPLPPEVRETIWLLRTEGKTYREIRVATGCSPATINSVLQSDIPRLETAMAALREERITNWQQIVAKGQRNTIRMLDAANTEFFDPNSGELKHDAKDNFHKNGARWTAVASQAAAEAERYSQLLVGEATDRVESAAVNDPGADDMAIAKAVTLGEAGVAVLPAHLKVRARKILDGEA